VTGITHLGPADRYLRSGPSDNAWIAGVPHGYGDRHMEHTADDLDRAANLSAERIAIEIFHIRQRANEAEAEQTGRCLYCGAPLLGRRWCDAGCRDYWQAEKDMAKRQGHPDREDYDS